MKAAEDGRRCDAAHVLDGAADRGVLVERSMSPQLIIIDGVLRQNPAQVRFAQGDHMVDALASDRSDQSFGERVLPRRAWSDRFVADAHGTQAVPDGSAVDLIPIADQVARASFQGNASVIWRLIQSALGFVVTLIQTRSRRASRTMTRP